MHGDCVQSKLSLSKAKHFLQSKQLGKEVCVDSTASCLIHYKPGLHHIRDACLSAPGCIFFWSMCRTLVHTLLDLLIRSCTNKVV
jgi:hypothetical protein